MQFLAIVFTALLALKANADLRAASGNSCDGDQGEDITSGTHNVVLFSGDGCTGEQFNFGSESQGNCINVNTGTSYTRIITSINGYPLLPRTTTISTDVPRSPPQTMGNLPSSEPRTLPDIDDAIAELEAQLALLRHRKEQLPAVPPATISDLPAELLLAIFSFIGDSDGPVPPIQALRLSHVSAAWRAAATEIRELWTSIPIDIYPKRAEGQQATNILHGDVRFLCHGAESLGGAGDGAFQLIALFCRRAGSTGIDLRIITSKPRARPADARAVVRVFSRLLESIAQWRSVTLPSPVLKLLDEIGWAHRNTALPLLQHLQITDSMIAGIPTKPLSLLANAPNLQSLEISSSAIGSRNVKLQWQNLTRLVLRNHAIAPALELLVETGIAAQLRRSYGLTLPALDAFVLAHPSHPELVRELTLPTLPTLEMHTISDRDGARGTAHAIRALVRRSERASELATEDDFDLSDLDAASASAAPSTSSL
ncbi:hypothetical protein MKEN_01464400 [Mycena kentingensis (nom. inval.)]|nr:hypothetical protein MKEN_01464400 [Mycena kentingensis (nom. inval.)]